MSVVIECPGCGEGKGVPMLFQGIETHTAGCPPCPQGFGQHDHNRKWGTWKCSKGHLMHAKMYMACPCGWTGERDKEGKLIHG